MPNIQIVKENSLGLNRGIYADWMGNALSDANANTLLAEGSAVTVGYREPSLNDALNASQQANTNIKGVAGVGNGKVFDENGNEIAYLGVVITLSASRTLTPADNGATLVYPGSSDIVLTYPTGLPSTFAATVVQAGNGKVDIVAGAGVTQKNLGGTNGANTFCTIQASSATNFSIQNPNANLPNMASGLPMIRFSSWSFGANGALTLAVALPVAFPSTFVYFEANSISASNAAGWYYTTFSTTTAGTVYNNTYTSGAAVIPLSPTPFSGPAGSVTVASTTPVVALSAIVKGGTLGPNGWIRAECIFQSNNSANSKTAAINYGGGSLFSTPMSGANIYNEVNHRMMNCGQINRQIARSATYNSFNGAPNYTSVDSSADQALTVVLTLATAATGDYVMVTGFGAKVWYGA